MYEINYVTLCNPYTTIYSIIMYLYLSVFMNSSQFNVIYVTKSIHTFSIYGGGGQGINAGVQNSKLWGDHLWPKANCFYPSPFNMYLALFPKMCKLKGKCIQNERGVKYQYFDVLNRSARLEVTFGVNIRSQRSTHILHSQFWDKLLHKMALLDVCNFLYLTQMSPLTLQIYSGHQNIKI